MRYTEFGQQIMNARLNCGLSRMEVACAVSVDLSFYARVERGLRMVSLITFALLWKYLDFDAAPVLATLPVRWGDPNKRQQQRKLRRPHSRIELASLLSGFDSLIARARWDAGLTQEDLASAVGLSRRQIGRIETGHGLPSIRAFAAMHRVLGFEANRMLGSLIGVNVPAEPYRGFRDAIRAAQAMDGATTPTLFSGFGEAIKSARDSLSMSADEVARAVGCNLDRYHRIERGTFLPTMREAIRIHRAVRFDADVAMRAVWKSDAIELLG